MTSVTKGTRLRKTATKVVICNEKVVYSGAREEVKCTNKGHGAAL